MRAVSCLQCGKQKRTRADRPQYRKGFCSRVCERSHSGKESFYQSKKWQALKYESLKTNGRECSVCKKREGRFDVVHIKPFELNVSNTKVVCIECQKDFPLALT